MGFSVDLKPLQSLGYAQVLQMLNGSVSLEEAITLTQQFTRNYSKRQLTWFRGEQNVLWILGFGYQQETYSAARRYIEEHGF